MIKIQSIVSIDLDSSLIKFVENGSVFMCVELFFPNNSNWRSISNNYFPCKVPLYFATFQITYYYSLNSTRPWFVPSHNPWSYLWLQKNSLLWISSSSPQKHNNTMMKMREIATFLKFRGFDWKLMKVGVENVSVVWLNRSNLYFLRKRQYI